MCIKIFSIVTTVIKFSYMIALITLIRGLIVIMLACVYERCVVLTWLNTKLVFCKPFYGPWYIVNSTLPGHLACQHKNWFRPVNSFYTVFVVLTMVRGLVHIKNQLHRYFQNLSLLGKLLDLPYYTHIILRITVLK